MRKIGFGKIALAAAVFCAAATIAAQGQTFATLGEFTGANGANPDGAVLQAADGSLEVPTFSGGGNPTYGCPFTGGCGTIEKIENNEFLGNLPFCSKASCDVGWAPTGALVQGTNGILYGATVYGGSSPYCSTVFSNNYGCGTIFELTQKGVLTILYTFCSQPNCADGALPNGPLVRGLNGNFYGTTQAGGANCALGSGGKGCGTVFQITTAGKLTTLYSFCSQISTGGGCTDGMNPLAGLVLSPSGTFLGTTTFGGTTPDCPAFDCGTVFEISPAGHLTRLHSFCSETHCTDGNRPYAGLTQASNGKFYGTTSVGGSATADAGTIFEIATGEKLTTLYTFCSQTNCSDGIGPLGGLVQGTDGNLYGTTSEGGTSSSCPFTGPPVTGCGTIFQITLAGTLTTLYNFCSQSGCPDGELPKQTLFQGTDASFYGTTYQGGDTTTCRGGTGCGTVFSLSMGLAPFVQANPNFGKPGAVIDILGSGLTGATGVTFNGTVASFTVEGDTYIQATIPAGAASGTIQVTTPSGTLSSNVAFQVSP
jgi:uncharacterized repeat protein (TIGR03803 family)